ncbi:MAG TPA: hypothetical protein VJJ76_02300 [archaeon]|nr:hypothetical protein [archaeon]
MKNENKNEKKSKRLKGDTDYMMWFIIVLILSIALIGFFLFIGYNEIKVFLERGLTK